MHWGVTVCNAHYCNVVMVMHLQSSVARPLSLRILGVERRRRRCDHTLHPFKGNTQVLLDPVSVLPVCYFRADRVWTVWERTDSAILR